MVIECADGHHYPERCYHRSLRSLTGGSEHHCDHRWKDWAGPITVIALPQPAVCDTQASLTIDVTTAGSLRASTCTLNEPLSLNYGPFPGPQPGGLYFYDRYTIDIPAGAIVRFDETHSFPNFANLYVIGFRLAGPYLATGYSSSSPLIINNASGSTARYEIVVTSSRPIQTGLYTIRPTRVF